MTRHEYMAEMALERFLEDPDGLEALRLARQGLREGRWEEEYIEAIGQHSMLEPRSWPEEQIAAFAEVHTLVYGGHVANVLVGTGGEPRRDADREENAAILATLPHPFTAEVDMRQRLAQGDGLLTWSEPVRVSLATGLIERRQDGSTCPLRVSFQIPPGSAILEIGSTLPSRTWMHLIDRGCKVARWPYGHDRIRLMVNLDETTTIGYRAVQAMKRFRKPRRSA